MPLAPRSAWPGWCDQEFDQKRKLWISRTGDAIVRADSAGEVVAQLVEIDTFAAQVGNDDVFIFIDGKV